MNFLISVQKRKGTAPEEPAEYKLNHVCDLNQHHGTDCFEMDGRLLRNQGAAIKPPCAAYLGNQYVVTGKEKRGQ
ncbi:hypothetical protein [Pleomorphovibrio marinus]|uniref:hypothetical protein n=1 Tax=Pleomorphovibrio marinus TaxID=2164132 RepID=UPI000E0B626B|nr:hypothetical protein [Pleomorphovibrio marinus]